MKLALDIPNFTTLSRRGETISLSLPKDGKEGSVMLIRSPAENAVYRFKTTLGNQLKARTLAN